MENRCIFCGQIIPEGLQVCPNCTQDLTPEDPPLLIWGTDDG